MCLRNNGLTLRPGSNVHVQESDKKIRESNELDELNGGMILRSNCEANSKYNSKTAVASNISNILLQSPGIAWNSRKYVA